MFRWLYSAKLKVTMNMLKASNNCLQNVKLLLVKNLQHHIPLDIQKKNL